MFRLIIGWELRMQTYVNRAGLFRTQKCFSVQTSSFLLRFLKAVVLHLNVSGLVCGVGCCPRYACCSRHSPVGFWGSCFNDYMQTEPHVGYHIIKQWCDVLFGTHRRAKRPTARPRPASRMVLEFFVLILSRLLMFVCLFFCFCFFVFASWIGACC